MARTKSEMLAEATKLESGLNKLSGKELAKAKRKIYVLRYFAKKKNGSAKPIKKNGSAVEKKAKKNNSKATDSLQAFLPGFSEMFQMKIEEMAREIVFNALKRGLELRELEESAPTKMKLA